MAPEKSLVLDLVKSGSTISQEEPLIRMQRVVAEYPEGRLYCFIPVAFKRKVSSFVFSVQQAHGLCGRLYLS